MPWLVYNGSGSAPDTCSSGPCATSPVQVSGLTGIVAIAAGGSHSLALRDNGSVYAWGNGTSGQLGNGASSSSHTGSTDAANPYTMMAMASVGAPSVNQWAGVE